VPAGFACQCPPFKSELQLQDPLQIEQRLSAAELRPKAVVMNLSRSVPAVLTLALLASCTSQKEKFNAQLPIMKESPSARARVIAKCTAHPMQPEELDQIAFYVKVQRNEVKQVMCQRLMSGVVSGKITYDDFEALFQKKMVTPALVSVLKGR
jgi:hypothetical protein